MEKTLELDPVIHRLAERFADKHHALFLGRGALYPIAMEGALKLKEISYIHAEAYPAGELKHGPLALVDADMPVVAVAPNNDLLEKLKSNLQEVRARGGELIVFADPESGLKSSDGVTVDRDAAARDLRAGAGGLHDPAAAARLSRGDPQGHRRGSAAQPRQERDGRVARRGLPPHRVRQRRRCPEPTVVLRYDAATMVTRASSADLLAGLAIAGLLLPEAVAYSGLANLPPQAGVIALFAGLLCYGLIGRSRYAIVTATSSSAAVLASALVALGAS